MPGEASLGRVQAWMQASVMDPAAAREPTRYLASSGPLAADAGLRIYARAHRLRMRECLQKEYPALLAALGDAAFETFADAYLDVYPPSSYTLARLGERFPAYLQETRPSSAPKAGWEDFIIDLAVLERAFFEAFDAPGSEKDPLPRAAAVTDASAEELLALRAKPVPCLRLLTLLYPVHRYFQGVKRGAHPAIPKARKTFMAVNRREYIVRFSELSRHEFTLLQALAAGRTVRAAMRAAGTWKPAEVRRQMAGWIASGFFAQVGRISGEAFTASRR